MDVSRLFSFNGRIGRRAFWMSNLVLIGFAIVLMVLMLAVSNASEGLGLLVYWIGIIPMAWAGLAMTVKRWHDRGKSGKWVLISLVPIIGGIWAFVETGFLAGDAAANEYGAPESGSPFDREEPAYRPV